tara:strand:+ start:243 stop:674 length:432 start_codon:yes stop_codon:yes gene_type:complete
MAITSAICTSFKVELLKGVHNLSNGANTINVALYAGATASLGASTTAYTTTGEITGTGYTAKGQALTNVTPVASGTTAVCDFADETFSSATITASGCLLFNDTATGDPAIAAISFGGQKTSTAGDFTIVFPSPTATGAIIRLA